MKKSISLTQEKKAELKNQLKSHPYLMPKVYSIWICCFDVEFCDNYREDLALYRASDVGKSGALPIYPKKMVVTGGGTAPNSL